jgi:hypothetical protein
MVGLFVFSADERLGVRVGHVADHGRAMPSPRVARWGLNSISLAAQRLLTTLLGPSEGPLRGRLAEDDLRLSRVDFCLSAYGRKCMEADLVYVRAFN